MILNAEAPGFRRNRSSVSASNNGAPTMASSTFSLPANNPASVSSLTYFQHSPPTPYEYPVPRQIPLYPPAQYYPTQFPPTPEYLPNLPSPSFPPQYYQTPQYYPNFQSPQIPQFYQTPPYHPNLQGPPLPQYSSSPVDSPIPPPYVNRQNSGEFKAPEKQGQKNRNKPKKSPTIVTISQPPCSSSNFNSLNSGNNLEAAEAEGNEVVRDKDLLSEDAAGRSEENCCSSNVSTTKPSIEIFDESQTPSVEENALTSSKQLQEEKVNILNQQPRKPDIVLERNWGFFFCQFCFRTWVSQRVWCVKDTMHVFIKQPCNFCNVVVNPKLVRKY